MRVTLRDISLSTWPRHFSHIGIESTVVMALGRRVRPMSMIPMSAACCARKRNSIDWAFSLFRAYIFITVSRVISSLDIVFSLLSLSLTLSLSFFFFFFFFFFVT